MRRRRGRHGHIVDLAHDTAYRATLFVVREELRQRPGRPSGNSRHAASLRWYPSTSVPWRPRASTCSRSSIASIVADRLCRSIPITTRLIVRCLIASYTVDDRRGRQRYFELDTPLLSHSRLRWP